MEPGPLELVARAGDDQQFCSCPPSALAFYPRMGFSNTHLSYSRVERYEQCPHAFRLHYVDKIPADPGPELRFGKALHRVLELLLRDHVRAGQTAALSLEHAEHLWQLAWRDEGLIGVGAFYEGLRMLAAFVGREGAVDPASVLGIEQPFELQVGRFRADFARLDHPVRDDVITQLGA